MNNVHTLNPGQKSFDEASAWIAKLDKGLSNKEKQALQQWMAASPENQRILLKMAEIWDKMDALSRLSHLFPKTPTSTGRSPRLHITLAASVLFVGICALVSSAFFNFLAVPDQQLADIVDRVYETAIGEHSSVNLPDGTQLVLNTNSLVKVNYTNHHRLLVLERGEIHVRVAHDKSRPLSVLAGNKVVQAVGTAFNVEINSDQQVEIVVTDGKVLVAVHQNTETGEDDLAPKTLPPSSVAVSKGERLLLGESDEKVEKIKPEEIQVKLSWREGNLVFRGESLEDAVAEISRYTQVEFVILDDNLKKVRIAGLFKAGDIKGLLLALRKNFNITYQRIGEDKVLLGAK